MRAQQQEFAQATARQVSPPARQEPPTARHALHPTSPTQPALRFTRAGLAGILTWALATGHAAVLQQLSPPTRVLDTEYVIDNWQTDQGMPDGAATAMVQTPDGYLWVGTFGGLARFDGTRFEVFHPGNTPALKDGGIVNLHLDRGQRLWISTLTGLAVMEGLSFRTLGIQQGYQGGYVRSWSEPAHGPLIATTFDGRLYEFHPDRVVSVPPPPDATRDGFFVAHDSDGYLHLKQFDRLYRREAGAWIRVTLDPPLTGTYSMLAAAREGGFWILEPAALRRFDRGRVVQQVSVPLQIAAAWGLTEDQDGTLWIPSHQYGLYRVLADGRGRHFVQDRELPDNAMRFVFRERGGTLWAGSSGGGLLRLRPRSVQVLTSNDGLHTEVVRTLAIDPEGHVVAGSQGFGAFRLERGRFAPLQLTLSPPAKATYFRCATFDAQGTFFFGLQHFGFHAVRNGQAFAIRPTDDPFDSAVIKALALVDATTLLAAGNNLVMRLQWNGQGYDVSTLEPDIGEIYAIAHAQDTGLAWLGGPRGLFTMLGTNVQPAGAATGRPRNVTALCFNQPDTLWIGTAEAGLIRWRQGIATVFDSRNGLPSTRITGLVNDPDGILWVATRNGILRLDPATLDARSIEGPAALTWLTRDEGLLAPDCVWGSQPSMAIAPDRQLYVATPKGVAIIDTRKIRTPPRTPPALYIQEVQFNPGSADSPSPAPRVVKRRDFPAAPAPLVLDPGSGRLEIQYACLDYDAPNRTHYRIRMDGIDSGWTEAGNRTSAYYHQLPPGDYRFRVAASTKDGQPVSEAALALRIEPFLWQTRGFQSAAAVLATALLGSVVWGISRSRYIAALRQLAHQRAVSTLQARLALVLENTADIVIFFNEKLDFLYANPAAGQTLGWTGATPPVGRSLRDCYPPGDFELLASEAVPSALSGRVWQAEATLRGADGREVPVLQTVVAHRNPSGQVEFLSAIARDITDARKARSIQAETEARIRRLNSELEARVDTRTAELEAANGRLAAANRELDAFSYSVSHDLKAPLRAVSGFLGLLKQKTRPTIAEEHRRYIDHAAEGAVKMAQLIDNLLAFARLGRTDLDQRPTDMNALVQAAWQEVHPPALNPAVRLRCAALPCVIGDSSTLRQVWVNLLGNAIKYTRGKPEPTVEIRVLDTPTEWQFSVQDNGAGFDMKYASRLFGVFSRLHHDHQFEGTGIGLANVHRIITRHGGRVWAEGVPESGATFHFTLPRVSADATPAVPPQTH